jgi:perosamine synthetase
MLKIACPDITNNEVNAVKTILRSGLLAQGLKVRELEENIQKYCLSRYAIAVCNGTSALHLALLALGIKQGDEVITTPFSFIATANVILMVGGKVIFADIERDSFNISPKEFEKKITKKTKAIITVDLFGNPINYSAIRKICHSHKIKLVADSCQALGGEYCGKKVGSLADISAFSLYATKNITCGEGGLITTNNHKYANLCQILRHHGQDEKKRYEYKCLGYNFRMTDFTAAIAVEQLKKIDTFNSQRIKNAIRLNRGLSGIKGLEVPEFDEKSKHVFHQYAVRVTREFKHSRSQLMKLLKEKNIGCGIYYPKPLHLANHFRKLGYKKGDFPEAEKASSEVLSLPVHPKVTTREIDYIINTIDSYAR